MYKEIYVHSVVNSFCFVSSLLETSVAISSNVVTTVGLNLNKWTPVKLTWTFLFNIAASRYYCLVKPAQKNAREALPELPYLTSQCLVTTVWLNLNKWTLVELTLTSLFNIAADAATSWMDVVVQFSQQIRFPHKYRPNSVRWGLFCCGPTTLASRGDGILDLMYSSFPETSIN